MTVFFDPSKLSDLELEKKTDQINLKLAWAANYGSGTMVSGLQNILTIIENEKFERFARLVAKQQEVLPSIIESDPDLAAEHKYKEETKREEIAANKIHVTKVNIPRTAAPVVEKKEL